MHGIYLPQILQVEDLSRTLGLELVAKHLNNLLIFAVSVLLGKRLTLVYGYKQVVSVYTVMDNTDPETFEYNEYVVKTV